ncbi:MAG: homogentisate phytyltransferase [Coleofasciculus chthonoplastes F3-SA18-01]|jgi:homogentisate phytyltransferase/homogentisate geranylgeranyltransferase|uniref:homogentisate phytyltransferase n=1 Tax=Coleofasciculus chthonoplastes TaxID=64178 RepID=UPI0032F87A03
MSQISPSTLTSAPLNPLKQPTGWFYALWKFSRPHTIIGTTLSVLALYVIALAITDGAIARVNLTQLLGTWISCCCGNIYIVGLNQLEDVEIDQINKPHLPIAAGEFSRRQGKLIIAVTGLSALLLARILGGWLFLMVSVSLAIGTAYSLPPIRLKRFPFWAALCIFSVRGAVVNLGLFLHFSWVWQQGEAMTPTPAVWGLTLFVLVFTVAIALFKDVPDIDGDKLYNITTFTIRLGKPAVFNITRWIITLCYLGMILGGVLLFDVVNPLVLGITHLAALVLVWWRSQDVDLQDKLAIASFYQFIWKLFFLEYLMFPAACLLT